MLAQLPVCRRSWTEGTDRFRSTITGLRDKTILEQEQHRACIVRETEDGCVLVDGTFSYLKRQSF
jgi:hypothetical protein